MLKIVYDTFGLTYKMALSTRPAERLGDDALWDQAEGALQGALDATGQDWEVSQSLASSGIVGLSETDILGMDTGTRYNKGITVLYSAFS